MCSVFILLGEGGPGWAHGVGEWAAAAMLAIPTLSMAVPFFNCSRARGVRDDEAKRRPRSREKERLTLPELQISSHLKIVASRVSTRERFRTDAAPILDFKSRACFYI
jgi:hypothetical protein